MKRVAIIAFLLAGFSALSFAQGDRLPPGKWWRQQRVIQDLGLTEEQQTRLDAVFNATAEELIDLKADVEKRNVALRREMDEPQVNRQAVQRAAANLSAARGRLFERELMMFVDMRGVLNAEQWTRFRSMLDARDQHMRDQRKRLMHPGRGPMTPRPERNRPDRMPQPQPQR